MLPNHQAFLEQLNICHLHWTIDVITKQCCRVLNLYRHKVSTEMDPSTVAKLKKQLQKAEEEVQLLENKLKDAEEDAHIKAQEVSSFAVNID